MDRLKNYIGNWLPADYVIALLLITFPIYNRLMPVLMIVLGLTLFIRRRSLNEMIHNFKLNQPHIWFLIFYLAHAIGALYSENMDSAVNDLGIKFSFFILPILLTWSESRLTFSKVIELFLLGLVIAMVVLYSYAIFRSIYNVEDNHWAYFTESYLSFHMHRSYFATYVAIGSLLAVHRYFTSKKIWYIGLSLLLGITTILTISKAGILILIVTILPLIVILSVRYYSWLRGTVIVFGVIAIVVLAFFTVPRFKARFAIMFTGTPTEIATTNNPSVESNAARVIMWTTSAELIKEHPLLGVGTGDVSDEMDRRNFEKGNLGVAEKSMNAHNQYLNTGVQLGLLGLIPLLMILAVTFRSAVKERSLPLLLILTVIALTLLFESFLETQAGIIPVTLLISLFALKSRVEYN